MSTDNLKGTGNQIKGSVKETAGKATGDHALEGVGDGLPPKRLAAEATHPCRPPSPRHATARGASDQVAVSISA